MFLFLGIKLGLFENHITRVSIYIISFQQKPNYIESSQIKTTRGAALTKFEEHTVIQYQLKAD